MNALGKKMSILLMIFAMLFTFAACTKGEKVNPPEDLGDPIQEEAPNEEVLEEVAVPELEEESPYRSVLTGLPVEEAVMAKRPIAVMLDNHIGARPQSGLSDAEVAFEILAEGSITRYMAILQEVDMNSIGPVRSARPYFIDKALEFDALYVHVGGSVAALGDIKDFNMADINAMHRGGDIFWRVNHKKMPHNMYTSTKALRAAAKQSGYRTDFDIDFASFSKNDQEFKDSENIKSIRFGFTRYYKPSFVYNAENKMYERFVKDSPQLEEFSAEPITTKNIIVLKMNTEVIDSEGRLSIETVGSGTGYYITCGKKMDIGWEKESRKGKTVYTRNGEELMLNPGNTWIVIVPMNLEIEING